MRVRALVSALLASLALLAAPSVRSAVVYVNKNATGSVHDGQSWATAFTTVQGGVSAAATGDEVWVATSEPAAAFYPGGLRIGRNISVYGGFSGTESTREQRDPQRNATVLAGNKSGPVVTIASIAGQQTIVDGLAITDGMPSSLGTPGYAGIEVQSGDVTLSNDLITANGYVGLSVLGGSVSLIDSVVRDNGSDGIRISSTAAVSLVRDLITNNHGYGVAVQGGTVTAKNNVISANGNSGSGGGVTVGSGHSATLTGNVVMGNVNDGVYVLGTATLANNTFVGNDGHGIETYGACQATNNIVAFNGGNGVFANTPAVLPAFSHNDVYGNFRGEYSSVVPPADQGNISLDPNLSSIYRQPHLQPGSPCVNAGDDSVISPGQTDVCGKPRVIGPHVDIGADESDGTVWPSPATIWHVAPYGDDSNDGLTWSTAKKTINGALTLSQVGDEVWVAAGTYVENLKPAQAVFLYGGFAGTETERSQRNWGKNVTVVDGGANGHVIWASTHRCVYDGFTITHGGLGFYVTADFITISNNTITGNNGGIYVGGITTITSNVISANSSFNPGAGLRMAFGSAIVANNIISANDSQAGGGGIWVGGCNATIINNTITGNSANDSGGGIYLAGKATIKNNIVAFNASGVYRSGGGSGSLEHNDVVGNDLYNYSGMTDPTGSAGNISGDPVLTAVYGVMHIEPTSPCVDAGDDAAVVGTADVFGKSRIIGAHVDLGAEESDGTTWPIEPPVTRIRRVSPTGDDANDGSSWDKAKRTLAAAMAIPHSVDEVWVAKGTYTEAVTLSAGIALYGGFAGTETQRSQRDWLANPTVLDGNDANTVVWISGVNTVLDGFTIQNGKWNGPSDGGGGIACTGADAEIAHNIIRSNTMNNLGFLTGLGGGVYVNAPRVWIHDNTIGGNWVEAYGDLLTSPWAYADGGGLSVGSTGGVIERNVISGNYVSAASSIIGGCSTCFDPAGYGSGGGLSVSGSGLIVRDNLIKGNSAYGNKSSEGGGIVASGAVLLSNNTVVANRAGLGGGLRLYGGVTLANSIVAYNSSGLYGPSTGVALRNNDIVGNTGLAYDGIPDPTGSYGNISADPLFANRPAGDSHLSTGSPCIDAGDDSFLAAGETDLDGLPRRLGTHVDIGAYEFPVQGYFTLADAATALRIAGGLAVGNGSRLNVDGTEGIAVLDAVHIVRKFAGLESNP